MNGVLNKTWSTNEKFLDAQKASYRDIRAGLWHIIRPKGFVAIFVRLVVVGEGTQTYTTVILMLIRAQYTPVK